MVGCLVCNRWGFTAGTSHVCGDDVLAAALARVMERVTGLLGHGLELGLELELELGLGQFGFALRSNKSVAERSRRTVCPAWSPGDIE